jgi:hypothetical protein
MTQAYFAFWIEAVVIKVMSVTSTCGHQTPHDRVKAESKCHPITYHEGTEGE